MAAGIYDDLAWVSSEAAQRSLRSAISSRRNHRVLARRKLTVGIAACLIIALLLFTFSDLTPEARADSLLRKAAREELATPPSRRLLHLQSGENECRWESGPDKSQFVLLDSSASSFCSQAASNLHSAGWTDPLSAGSFARWRSSLKKKKDAITRMETETELTTSTQEGQLRSATLRVRASDDRVVKASFQFADSTGAEQSAFQVTEEQAPPQIAKLDAPARPPAPAHNSPSAVSFLDPLDEKEAQVRLGLHRLGADANVLLVIERKEAGIRVWGVVPDSETKSAVSTAMRALPDVEVDLLTEVEEAQQQAPLAWTAAHGDGPPLASVQMRTLFKDNPADRQVFLNGLDAATRKLAAEAATRDALLGLARRLRSSEMEKPLQSAIADFDARMALDISALGSRLQPLIGKIDGGAKHLSYAQAMDLYRLVHDVTFQSSAHEPPTLAGASARIRALLAAN